jgi:tetratricopeptide (TPR) repeat protein
MTSFGWKRKAPERSDPVQKAFDPSEQEAEEQEAEGESKRRRQEALEDGAARYRRLVAEGACLAEQGRYWAALRRWEEAAQGTVVEDARLWEMRAQALAAVHEWPEAVEAAGRASTLEPTWWAAHQTRGRALLGQGQLEAASTAFQKAVHLNPADEELRREDLVRLVAGVQSLHCSVTPAGLGARAAASQGRRGPWGGGAGEGGGAGGGRRDGAGQGQGHRRRSAALGTESS